MALFLRFTQSEVIENSFNHFTNEEFDGTCAYEIDEEEIKLSIRQVSEKDSTFLNQHNGNFVVFEGDKLMDNPYGYGVIAKFEKIVAKGQLVWNNDACTYKFERYEDL